MPQKLSNSTIVKTNKHSIKKKNKNVIGCIEIEHTQLRRKLV